MQRPVDAYVLQKYQSFPERVTFWEQGAEQCNAQCQIAYHRYLVSPAPISSTYLLLLLLLVGEIMVSIEQNM